MKVEKRIPRLARETIAITGKLASMSREEAIRAVEAAGAGYVAMPNRDTTLLVVGAGGPPLGTDGRLTESLRRARELQAQGSQLRILPEEEWLALLELGESQAELQRLYTTGQLARILGVSLTLVRKWVRQRLIVPSRTVRRLAFFDFQQVSSARALLELCEAGVPPGRIRKSLEQLAGWFEDGQLPLAQLEALAAGPGVFVRLDDGRVAEPTGQLLLEYDEPPPESAARLDGPGSPAHRAHQASALAAGAADSVLVTWFERGVHAEEEGCFEEAVYAYERALEEEGSSAETWFNLGNVRFVQDHKVAASEAFAAALELEPDYVEAWNNLANVQSELGRYSDAVKAYQRALAIAPEYADAHYNCAETLFAMGDTQGARRHWQAYLQRDPNSPWAAEVRKKLAALTPPGPA